MRWIAVFLLTIILNLASAQRSRFPDVLNITQIITDTNDIEKSCFSDQGAWHAYALPARVEDYGSFVGPLLMDMSGKWLGNTFSKLQVTEKGKVIRFDQAYSNYYPGMLQQVLVGDGLKVVMKLIFVSNRESLAEIIISDLSGSKRMLEVKFTGASLLQSTRLASIEGGVEVSFDNSEHLFQVIYAPKEEVAMKGAGYETKAKNIFLKPNGSYSTVQAHRYFLQRSEYVPYSPYNFSKELSKNEKRWSGYLTSYFLQHPSLPDAKKRIAVKSIVTLMSNWRSKAKDLLHDGIFPSLNYQGFYGVWSWDSWKQACGVAYFNPRLAQENIRCMFDFQDEHGMVADCIYSEKKENNWRDTKPPLAAWGVWKVYQRSRDLSFINEIYPKLVKYHQWWYANRDHDKNKLCEYGSTDGTRIAAAWESGMDNAVRFDSAVMLKNNDHAWSLNQESVDLNVYLYADKLYLALLADALQKKEEAKQWEAEASVLKDVINKNFFHPQRKYYYDKVLGKDELITVNGPEGWIPLWAGIAAKEQASGVAKLMGLTTKFNTKLPMPTLSADRPEFDPMDGYWRGPVWLDQFYFGIKGLRRYGHNKLAAEMMNKLWANAEGMNDKEPIFENYHPKTGKGLNAINFSWSAAHLLMLLAEK